MKNHIFVVLLAAISLVAFSIGCGSVNKKTRVDWFSQTDLQNYAEEVLTEEEQNLFSVPYAISDELVALAKTVADPAISRIELAKRLALLLLVEGGKGLGISYRRNRNFTAMEVYEKRQANCISYTNLYIGMARALGINANYAEVTEIETFDKIGNTVVFNSHVCAVVFHGTKPYLIDFSLRKYPQYHSWRVIDDIEATASFYNNIGAYFIVNKETPDNIKKAKAYFEMVIKLQPDFAQVYNNMGVLYSRQRDMVAAERMYRKALAIKPGYFAPYNNLSSIYTSRGQIDQAIQLLHTAIDASPENYYAYLALAKNHIMVKDMEQAEEALQKALRVNKRFTDARHELGRLYLRTGRGKEAMKQFALALKYQPDDDLARNKMDLIARLSMAEK